MHLLCKRATNGSLSPLLSDGMGGMGKSTRDSCNNIRVPCQRTEYGNNMALRLSFRTEKPPMSICERRRGFRLTLLPRPRADTRHIASPETAILDNLYSITH